jgi:CRP-like cAMP-binding protein/DNA-binding response OmpR family regulator
MVEFGPRSLEKVVAFIGERDDQTRKDLEQILSRAGVKLISAHDNLAGLIALMEKTPPDLIMVADDLDPGVFDFIRNVRHHKIGVNPFVLVTTLVAPERADSLKHALQSGTDDIIVKPVKEDQLLQRLRRVTLNRQAFVVTSDYLGPDRRGKNRPSSIRRINVLNTMLEKAHGRELDAFTLTGAVDNSMNEVLQGRLDSHGYRLGFVGRLIIDAYDGNKITPDIKEKIMALADVLRDAAKTAQRLGETELTLLCGSLTKQVTAIADHYNTPTQADLALLRKINKAVVAAVKPRVTPAQLQQDARDGAAAYQRRERAAFQSAADIQRTADEAPMDVVDEPVIEIMPLQKGQYLFRQGEPATSAYIVTSGTIAIYREKDGQRLPVAKVRKGEFFGEMAIVDGTNRRASAFALEDSTLSLVAKDVIERKMAACDPLVRAVVQMLINSLRAVHDIYTPKSRNVSDSVREMRDQVDAIASYLGSPSAPPDLATECADSLRRLRALTGEMVALIERFPHLDPRTPALPQPQELPRQT